jgi:ABC-type branched-subunit amino acid transport system substrate-binding protein
MKKNNRIKYEIVKGDDASKPANGTTEAKRLISQEKVEVLTGCLSSAVGLAVSATAQESNTFFLAIGAHDTNITGPKAHRVTFRQTCSNAMLANAIGPELLKHGKKWYFLVADYAFGTDGATRLKKILLAHGGTISGEDLHPLGQTDYSSYLTKARNTDADVLFFSNYGPDCQNATKAAVQLGLNKKMTFGGILSGNDVAVGMPVDDIVKNIINRLNAAGTTETEKIVEAFENYHYDAAKKSGAYFRKCDHQAVQQTYAGVILPKNKRRTAGEYFGIASTVGGDFAAESCSNPDSAAAEKIISSEKIGPREGYTVVKV